MCMISGSGALQTLQLYMCGSTALPFITIPVVKNIEFLTQDLLESEISATGCGTTEQQYVDYYSGGFPVSSIGFALPGPVH